MPDLSTMVDLNDTGRTLAKLDNGDFYGVELASVWRGPRCIGTEIVASSGPLHYTDVGLENWSDLGRLPTLVFKHLRDMEMYDEDAEWLQEQESWGALSYPLGYAAATIDALLCK